MDTLIVYSDLLRRFFVGFPLQSLSPRDPIILSGGIEAFRKGGHESRAALMENIWRFLLRRSM